jgi:bifunctional UDP-N-acetylglucosamine pyrophosphorylase/glucosamine-1-phosphate N-acetyltransferase
MINSGIYCIRSDLLCKHLPYLQNNNNQQEYYLTDIIEIIKKEENIEIGILEIEKDKQIEIMGVNTLNQLNELELLVNMTPFNVF